MKERKLQKPIIEWVEIPAGKCTIGSPLSEVGRNYDECLHKMVFSAFKISKYAVTFEQYDVFCEATGRKKTSDDGWGRGNRPVINVNWYDAVDFAEWMNSRLPSESEWEYACKAETTTQFYTGSNLSTDQANYDGNLPYFNYPKGVYRGQTTCVGSFPSNPWGLYDMLGNVWEWCFDLYEINSCKSNPDQIKQVTAKTSCRVIRGGCWDNDANSCRSASRDYKSPYYSDNYIGFRLVSISAKSDVQNKKCTHDWRSDCEKCSLCGLIQKDQHDYSNNCNVCSKCGQTRISKHVWDGNICTKCGLEKIAFNWADIPAGVFTMGDPESKLNYENPHQVTLNAFKISKYAVTFEQYDLYCEETGRKKPDDEGWGRGKRPVINVSLQDANDFSEWIGCRLPNDAEWEYACRAGSSTRFNTGDTINCSQANFNDNCNNNQLKGFYRAKTLTVGSFPPNAWGIYDMHGNVEEWCLDWFHGGKHLVSPNDNPKIDNKSTIVIKYVCRGGSWNSEKVECKSGHRVSSSVYSRHPSSSIGFRVVSENGSLCGKFDDEQHDWSKDCHNCAKCGYTRKNQHYWVGNNCIKCDLEKPTIEWIDIPAGTFNMGSPFSEVDRYHNEFQHKVSLNAFKMSKYEVTFEQYDFFCLATGREKPSDEGWGRGRYPVINVSWYDAVAFAKFMSCRLPTEAEWEYACRAGTTTPFYTGNNITCSQANFNGYFPYNNNPRSEGQYQTLPVGKLIPNEWGLYDMHGNVWEWCHDFYDEEYYLTSPMSNPKGPPSGWAHIFRGGGCKCWAKLCRAAMRNYDSPDTRKYNLGFRLVLVEQNSEAE